MTQNFGGLGRASGIIGIDVSQLRDAARVVDQVAQQMTRAFASVNAQLAQVGNVNSSVARLMTAELRKQTAEINAQASAARSAANVEIAATRERIAILQQEAKQRQQVATAANAQASSSQRASNAGQGGGGGGGLGNRPTPPAFIQFGLFPFAGLAQGFGASGLSSGLMQAGNVLGAVDAINPLLEGLSRVAGRFRDFGGILGSLANNAVNAQGTLSGATSAIATIGLVAAPFVAIIGLMSAAMSKAQEEFEKARKSAENYIGAQTKLSDLISGGATSADIAQRIQSITAQRDSRQQLVDRIEPLLTEFQNLATNQFVTSNRGSGMFGSVTDEDRQARARFQQIGSELQTTFGTVDVAAIRAALEPYKAEIAGLNAEISAGIDPANAAKLAMNDMNAAITAARESVSQYRAAEVAFTQQVRGMSASSARDRLQDNQTERNDVIAALNTYWDDLTEKQREAFQARISQLGMEIDVINKLLPQLQFQEVLNTAAKIAEMRQQSDREMERINADRNLADDREYEDFVRGRVRAQQDFARQQAQAEAEFLAKRKDVQEKFQEERAQAESDFQDRLAKLIRDARLSILESAARLDARGVFEQRRRLNQQIADMTDEQRKQRDQRQKQLEDQLADQQKAFDDQRAAQLAEFTLRMNREAEDRRIRLAREEYDRQVSDQRRVADFNYRVQQLLQQNNVVANIVEAGKNSITFIWSSLMSGLVSQTQGAYTQVQSNQQRVYTVQQLPANQPIVQPYLSPYKGFQAFATGTSQIFGTTPAMLHNDESVLNAPAARSLRRALGSNFTMSQAQNFFENGGGGGGAASSVTWTGDLVLGDIGNRSDDEVMQLFSYGLQQFFGGAVARRTA